MSLLQLVEILKSKEPAYIRCIKPNDAKQPGRFDEVLIRHQVKYLGLMENLRVRRAGFAYRRKYEAFLQRYKSLCPETWPTWAGRPQDGVAVLVRHLGYKPEEYKMGRTKIFIRFPKTLFATEDSLEVRRQSLATKIQAAWRGFHWRQKFLRVKRSGVGSQGSFGGAGSRGWMDYHSETEVSDVWYPQPSVSSHGGVAHWAGERQPRGSGPPKLSVGE
ncbi:hypothetical protein NN561_018796 [Cricetulus griseus]